MERHDGEVAEVDPMVLEELLLVLHETFDGGTAVELHIKGVKNKTSLYRHRLMSLRALLLTWNACARSCTGIAAVIGG